jgi:carbamoylphosphate synthase large subunit/methylglyoxal synthase
MPKRTDLHKILIIGSGPIVIGQGCEFDYSGTQACRVLKAEGFEVILVNSNPATIMTDPEIADATYIEPLTVETVTAIIEKERPDALLPTVGGQTALNLAVELDAAGILEKYSVELIGANIQSIKVGEDRELFKAAMDEIGIPSAKGGFAHTWEEAREIVETTGYPAIIRPSFTLGGTGGGVAFNPEEFEEIAKGGLAASPNSQILIEESILGWKEYELELMRDLADNVVVICAIENFDPMGVHTGDSITVAPAQTLSDVEYQKLRDMSIACIRRVGVETGGSNIQFAVNPANGEVRIIEMNPRVSRSSALASKATGFPIAKIAAKLAVGYTLDEIPNDITKKTPASFEPTIDYVVTKIPKWAFEKFAQAEDVLGTQMKSVGEVMAIGRTFKESLFKGLRSLESAKPLRLKDIPDAVLQRKLARPNSNRFSYITYALQNGYSVTEIHRLTKIDPWFLEQLQEVMLLHRKIEKFGDVDNLQLKREEILKQKADLPVLEITGNEFNGNRKSAFIWANSNIQGKVFTNTETGFQIAVTRRGLDKALGESAVKEKQFRNIQFEIVRFLGKLLETAILGESHADRADDPNLKQLHRFYSAIWAENQLLRIKLTIKEYSRDDVKGFYSYEINEIETLNVVWDIGFSEGVILPRPSSVSIFNLLQDANKNNGNKFFSNIKNSSFEKIPEEILRTAKEFALSDRRISFLTNSTESEVRERRKNLGIVPVYKRVDTCGAEFESFTPYLYSTYEEECEAQPTNRRKIMILGSGPNRIGQGIEFDYCCCHASFSLQKADFETIMVNCNPETVSTDYDTSDRLYFEPLTFEDVMNIVEKEKPEGVIVQFGGQTPLNLALPLHEAGVPIIGTSPDSIDLAEDRKRFGKLLEELNIPCPANGMASSAEEAKAIANEIGYPVIVRPSYVLGGRAMAIVYDEQSLDEYMRTAVDASPEKPILVDKFLENAAEFDVDALADCADGTRTLLSESPDTAKESLTTTTVNEALPVSDKSVRAPCVVICGIQEHIEEAGIHSGDSSSVLPPQRIAEEHLETIRHHTRRLAKALNVIGLMNIQFAIKDDRVYVLEVNPRASRTVPFVSKATGIPLPAIASLVMAGHKTLAEFNLPESLEVTKIFVKSPVFPFKKFAGVDPILGPEMHSTGEVMGVGETFGEAYGKAMVSAGLELPVSGTAFISVNDADKGQAVIIARRLTKLGFKIIATYGTTQRLKEVGIESEAVFKVNEGRPNIADFIKQDKVSLVINTPLGKTSHYDEKAIRQAALRHNVPCVTTMTGANALVEAITAKIEEKKIVVRSLQEIHESSKKLAVNF